MAYTLLGFGTRFYGEADLRPDDSFVTTEWATVFAIPLVPLRSFRFMRIKECDPNVLSSRSESFAVLETLPICWPQVGRVYALLAGKAVWWAAMGWLFVYLKILDRPDAPALGSLFAALLVAPFLVVWWWRRRAFRVRYGSEPPPPAEKEPSEVPAVQFRHQGDLDDP